MASSAELTAYIAEQFGGAGEITVKKMFGEYGLYCGGKFFAMVCDDRCLSRSPMRVARSSRLCPKMRPMMVLKNVF